MNAAEIRGLSQTEVEEQLHEREEELSNLRMQLATRQLDNPILLRSARREVARLKTILREHDLEIHPLD